MTPGQRLVRGALRRDAEGISLSGGGARSAAVGQTEAEMLFRLKDATLNSVNAPGWERLFVQGVGNFLMGFSGHEPLSRERASELEAFLNDTHSRVGGFFGRMVRSGVDRGFRETFRRKPAAPGHDAVVSAAREITEDERLWLGAQFGGGEQLDPLEQALLIFIAEESGQEV